ncbi:hypothetical protein [Alcanivorax sp. 1008]|uniref:hypothetical protein n=1 Tax=Alcanivorax sp. 1008 TaxID=2816853 RepID=UPI001D9100B4|nr:hypothetical protein [Alcanivorax sp. 1008]MCC1496834.1 hypothetical protein [Alcanivorax sp. 1008]
MDSDEQLRDIMPPYRDGVTAGYIAYLGFGDAEGPKMTAHFLHSASTGDCIGFVHMISPDPEDSEQFKTQVYPVTYSKASVGARRIAGIIRQLKEGFWMSEAVQWMMLPVAGVKTCYGTALGEYCATIDKQSAASMRAFVSFFADRNGLIINPYPEKTTPATPDVIAPPAGPGGTG